MRNLKKKGETNPRGRNEEKNKGKESSLGPVIMGAVGRTEIGTKGTAETDAVNMAETGTEDTAGMVAMGAAGVAATDTPTFAAIPSPSKGSANKRNGHAKKKGRMNLAKKKKRGGKKAHIHGLLFFGFRNPPPQDRLIIKIHKNVFKLLRR